jgi:RNA polymerase sigma factor (sigma-70 family)
VQGDLISDVSTAETPSAIEAVFRIESPRLISQAARLTGDLGLAEELAQDALVAALEQWPVSGIPRNPGAWLTTVAKRRAVDMFRRNERMRRHLAGLARDQDVEAEGYVPDFDAAFADTIEDDLLRLVFIACHPVLPVRARTALTLRLLGGLTTPEIARAYLVSEATIAQRIVRAKKTLAKAGIPFEVPPPQERQARLSSVLEVIYLIFNEGHTATAGEDWMRPDLCHEAVRLGRVLAQLMPAEPEVHGLLALLELQASRLAARTSPAGEPVLLLDQDRTRWDRLLINRGLAGLRRCEQLGGADGPYALQAAIAACHARAFRPEDTDWSRIAALYEVLVAVLPSPVVQLNRAVAVWMASGAQAGLELVDSLADVPELQGNHLLPSVRGRLLEQLGRAEEAAAEFDRAAELARNGREQELLRQLARATRSG